MLWGLGSFFSGRQVSYVTVLTGVLVATAPQVWGFLVLIPYMGPAIGRILSAWSAVCLWAVTASTFGIGRWPALALDSGVLADHAPGLDGVLAVDLARHGRPVRGTDPAAGRSGCPGRTCSTVVR